MVLPAHVLEHKEVERNERTKDGEADEEKVKEGAEMGSSPEELQPAAVVMPTDTGRFLSGIFLHLHCDVNDMCA